MDYLKERELLVEYGNKLMEYGLTKGTGGNLSIYDETKGYMIITPSGIEFDKLTPEDMVVMDLDGKIISGEKKPSSEYMMHTMIYKDRKDIKSVVHAHTMYATVISCLRETLPAVHYMIALAGKDVRCAKYATFGTEELAINAVEAMKDRNAVLLANHGIITGAKNIQNAFNIVDEVEYCAAIYYRAKCIGNPIILDDAEMKTMEGKFQTYGQIRD